MVICTQQIDPTPSQKKTKKTMKMFVTIEINFLHQNSPSYSGYSWLKWAGLGLFDVVELAEVIASSNSKRDPVINTLFYCYMYKKTKYIVCFKTLILNQIQFQFQP